MSGSSCLKPTSFVFTYTRLLLHVCFFVPKCLNVICSKYANTLNVTTRGAIAYKMSSSMVHFFLLSQQFQENIAEHGG